MDLSINNIQLNKKNNVSFKGMMGEYSKDTVPVYKFTAPIHKKDEKVTLEIAFLERNEDTAQFCMPENAQIYSFDFPIEKSNVYANERTLEIPQEVLKAKSDAFGYRFKITPKDGEPYYALDPFKSIKIAGNGKNAQDRMNVIEHGRFYGISPKGGTMRHSFLDADVRVDVKTGEKLAQNKDFVRNHFNKLGGSIAGLNWLLKNTDELDPYTYFMTTPDIGADKVSSHRYWPSNHYQCSDLEMFKDFNFELFKRGKGYVADGAFTSQGLQSPLVQHVLKWGEQSPFYHWLKIDGIPSLGVLPDFSEIDGVNPYEHIGIRLINGKGANYDKTKPTYIQFYDNRLLSEDKIKSNELQFNYDINDVEDIYEITSHQDSVQPYAFEIDPNDKKLKVFKDGNSILLSEIAKKQKLGDFLSFSKFKIVEKNKVGGDTCWDGNVDIIKMNLSNPTNNPKNIQGYRDARQYLLGVATYWTKAIQAHLILETALSGENDIRKFAKNNGIDEKFDDIYKSVQNGTFVSSVKNEDSASLIRQFPLQTLETSEELSAIFAQKEFGQELFTADTLKKIAKKFDEVIDAASFGEEEQFQAYIKRAYGNEILRYIFVSAIAPEAIEGDSINLDKLKQVTLKSLEEHKSLSVQEERAQVIEKIQKGLDSVNLTALSNKISAQTSSIQLEDFQLAEAIVLQGKGGLNWRFDAAKDIGDLDAVRNGEEFDKIWNGSKEFPGVQDFWAEYVENIRKYNPAAYVINEVTTLGDFYDWKKDASMRRFDNKLANAYYALSDAEKENYENHVPYAKQVQFLNQTNSTTTSEYDKGFNKFSEFAGVNPENKVSIRDYSGTVRNAGNLNVLKGAMDSLMNYNQPNSAIYSHMFVSNHDKPSVLHTLPLNMLIFMAEDLEKSMYLLDSADKKLIKKLIGDNPNYKKVCPKAVGVGLAMLKVIEKLQTNPPQGINKISSEQAQKLEEQLVLLVNGQKTKTSAHSFKRAEAFAVKPYEITIKDLIQRAKIALDDETLDEMTKDFHYTMMEDSMSYFEKMWQVMNACVGVPTMYGGNEFVQTGYETPSKNIYLGIRNEVLHDLKNDKRYSSYFNKMQEISSMYKKPELSALRDGTPISCQMLGETADIQRQIDDLVKTIANEAGINDEKLQYFVNKTNEYLKKLAEGKITKDIDDEIFSTQKDAMDFIKPEELKAIQDSEERAKEYKARTDKYKEEHKTKYEKYSGDIKNRLFKTQDEYNAEFNRIFQETYSKVFNKLEKMEKLYRANYASKEIEISADDDNLVHFADHINTIKKVFDTKRELERKIKRVDPVSIWPMIKKNENSQTISIITNLNLPNKTASWQGERLSRINYSVSDIELKDKNGAHPFEVPMGYVLKKVGDDRTYDVRDGKIVATDGKPINLDDTVTTFYIEKKGKNPAYVQAGRTH